MMQQDRVLLWKAANRLILFPRTREQGKRRDSSRERNTLLVIGPGGVQTSAAEKKREEMEVPASLAFFYKMVYSCV
jgi:hypothetical protein